MSDASSTMERVKRRISATLHPEYQVPGADFFANWEPGADFITRVIPVELLGPALDSHIAVKDVVSEFLRRHDYKSVAAVAAAITEHAESLQGALESGDPMTATDFLEDIEEMYTNGRIPTIESALAALREYDIAHPVDETDGEIDDDVPERSASWHINRQFYTKLAERYGLRSAEHAREVFQQAAANADKAIDTIGNILGLPAQYHKTTDLIGGGDSNTTSILHYLLFGSVPFSSNSTEPDGKLQFEVVRKMILIFTGIEIIVRNMKVEVQEKMHQINAVLHEDVWSRDETLPTSIPIYVVVDCKTNQRLLHPQLTIPSYDDPEIRALIADGQEKGREIGYVALEMDQPHFVRQYGNGDSHNLDRNVLISVASRGKRNAMTLLKALHKCAIKKEGISKTIEDIIGISITAINLGDGSSHASRNTFRDLFHRVLRQRYPAVSIEPDEGAPADRGQKLDPDAVRDKIWLPKDSTDGSGDSDDVEHDPLPLETFFYSWENPIDYQTSVGEPDPRTGLYDGSHHRLFQIRRYIDLVPLIFPKAVHPELYKNGLDGLPLYVSLAAEQSAKVAKEILAKTIRINVLADTDQQRLGLLENLPSKPF